MKRATTFLRPACCLGSLGALLLLGGCREASDPAGAKTGPAKTETLSPRKSAPETTVAIPSPVLPPSPAIQAGPSETAPGLAARDLIGPLRDAYDRMDPLKDGWESEAFSAAAKKQLSHLKELLTASKAITPDSLANLAVAGVTATPFRPDQLSVVFEDDRLRVLRTVAPAASSVSTTGREALAKNLNQLRFPEAKAEAHLKIVRVFPEDEHSAGCEVLVDLSANSPHSRSQINATWSCRWKLTGEESGPMLMAVEVTRYEEITQENQPTPLFQDATVSLLKGDQAYQKQFLLPSDHWRARLPRELGIEPVANHGLAVGDVNGDDLDDLYVCQQGGLPNRLFLQQNDGTLRDFTEASGTGWLEYCAAALLVDLDNDGDRDLIVSQDFRLMVMENDGTGKFALAFGSSSKAQSFSLAAADYDNDGLVDFYVCGYNASQAELRTGAMGEPMPFHDANNGGPNLLFRNEGDLRFEDVTAQCGLEVNNTRFSFAAAWEDYDNDGDQDLYVANDYGRNCLYRNEGGKFTEVAARMRLEDTSSGMSVSWSDFNLDGMMDVYTSNMYSSAGNRITYQRQFKKGVPEQIRKQFQHIAIGNSLFQGVANKPFDDVGLQAGVNMGRWAWCSKFVDFNNDGWDDILVANGFISAEDTGDL